MSTTKPRRTAWLTLLASAIFVSFLMLTGVAQQNRQPSQRPAPAQMSMKRADPQMQAVLDSLASLNPTAIRA